jgi:DNA-binding NtrC family response regulator
LHLEVNRGHVLRSVAGNKTQAAHVLRMDRKTLYRKLRRWNAADRAQPGILGA